MYVYLSIIILKEDYSMRRTIKLRDNRSVTIVLEDSAETVISGNDADMDLKRDEIKTDENFSKIDFRITRRPSSLPKVSGNSIDWERYIDYRKSSVRSKVEHAFHIIKNRFNFNKVRYRGIAKIFIS